MHISRIIAITCADRLKKIHEKSNAYCISFNFFFFISNSCHIYNNAHSSTFRILYVHFSTCIINIQDKSEIQFKLLLTSRGLQVGKMLICISLPFSHNIKIWCMRFISNSIVGMYICIQKSMLFIINIVSISF